MSGQIGFWKQLAGAAVLVAVAGFVWQERTAITDRLGLGAAESERTVGASRRAVPVIVTRVSTAKDDLLLEAVGTGRAKRSIMLRSEAEGKVVEMPLAAGVRFKPGDVLLRLDDADQRLALALAEARHAEADRVRARFESLGSAGTASVARLDEVQTAFEIAEIERERAREALEDRVLRAPFAGVPGLPEIEVGAWIDSDVEIASYDDRSVILVEFELPEGLISRVRRQLAVTATTPSAPGLDFDGTVEAIDSRVAAASRTARVRVAIPNPDDRLRPGASFVVRLNLPGRRFPVVPELAVQFSRGTLHVWRVTDGTAERIEVELVRRLEGNVLIKGPLHEGDQVVIEGTQRLTPGKSVEVIERGSGGSS